ncbi:uncharacterized protein [Dasypus novemcinctus]|uniref:uncharacterized protein n=1 Tax=Dasypus novemcinctus TaxID=9361 RepID=UPI00265F2CCE|nr:basic proline-rich protein-like [Dasypus novemcinctus]
MSLATSAGGPPPSTSALPPLTGALPPTGTLPPLIGALPSQQWLPPACEHVQCRPVGRPGEPLPSGLAPEDEPGLGPVVAVLPVGEVGCLVGSASSGAPQPPAEYPMGSQAPRRQRRPSLGALPSLPAPLALMAPEAGRPHPGGPGGAPMPAPPGTPNPGDPS